MKIVLLEEAQYELDQAIDYYNLESAGLGDQFLQEVLNALDRIANFKDAWHPLSENTSKVSDKAFPLRFNIR